MNGLTWNQKECLIKAQSRLTKEGRVWRNPQSLHKGFHSRTITSLCARVFLRKIDANTVELTTFGQEAVARIKEERNRNS